MIRKRPGVQGSRTFRPPVRLRLGVRPLSGRVLFFFFLLLPGGCFGTPASPSNPGFMIVVNQTSTTGPGSRGLLEYTLPLSSGQGPLVTRTAHGTYAGGVIAQTFLFVFGTLSGTPTLWRYSLPLSTAPSPTELQGFAGTPVAALSIANGQFVVFLEQTTSGGACLEGFTFGSLVDDTGPALPSPSLDCTNAPLSLGGAPFTTGGLQLSGNGSQVYVEASTSSETEVLTVSAGGLSSGSLQVAATHTLFSSSLSGPFQGATESTTLLLLPDPYTPAVIFYAVTGLSQGGGTLSPTATNAISVTLPPNLLATGPFGTFLYAAVTNPSSSSVPAIQSFDISTLQSGPGPTAPFAQTGSGLHPAGLITFTASQG